MASELPRCAYMGCTVYADERFTVPGVQNATAYRLCADHGPEVRAQLAGGHVLREHRDADGSWSITTLAASEAGP
ncbi:MAG TPA: hypothetical protein VHK06_02255 [Candidatus Limnocylindria bacterium]|jgi:hypothetical protein|nr:hypothetical protein [Candidatus Limnocylindria bacterium]